VESCGEAWCSTTKGGRHPALAADELAVPVDFEGVVYLVEEDLVLAGRAGGRLQIDMAAIPGVPGIGGVGLSAPGMYVLIDRKTHLLPPAIIVFRLGVLRIVAEGELPVAVDVDDSVYETLYDKDAVWRGFRGRGWAGLLSSRGDCTKQDERSEEDAAPHTVSIPPGRLRADFKWARETSWTPRSQKRDLGHPIISGWSGARFPVSAANDARQAAPRER